METGRDRRSGGAGSCERVCCSVQETAKLQEIACSRGGNLKGEGMKHFEMFNNV